MTTSYRLSTVTMPSATAV